MHRGSKHVQLCAVQSHSCPPLPSPCSEPTSGLDARAAAIVIRAVRNTVNTGRTVVRDLFVHAGHIAACANRPCADPLRPLPHPFRKFETSPLGAGIITIKDAKPPPVT